MSTNYRKHTNRLALETSPYLLQHAHNPVDWYPWGNEAFAKAESLGLPILLSIGYSTCHWCHVMEHESFEDLEIAAYMNANYICIKVDREERPDIDAVYMSAVQATTGRGGWPTTVWLTSKKKPFYAGTYFPPRKGARGAQFGFIDLLQHLRQKFDENPSEVARHAQQIAAAVVDDLESGEEASFVSSEVLRSATQFYKARYDSECGGLTGQPKFPSSFPIRTLLRLNIENPDSSLSQMISNTLVCMANGGIYDQVAGGFHRYSTDAQWLVPHFEKMLYDNALLARAYVEAYQVTSNKFFASVAREIFDYIAKDMTSPEGVFYSATDADSLVPSGQMEEGYFFTWTLEELKSILTADEFEFTQSHYNATAEGNFEGRNILFVKKDTDTAAMGGVQISSIKEKLYRARGKRPLPLRDEKILSAWNGLMISALAKGAFALNEASLLARAQTAAHHIFDNMVVQGKLLRAFKDGKGKQPGFLDDYAFLIAAFIDLYEASGEIVWLKRALDLDNTLNAQFEDLTNGGFFMTGHDYEVLIAREKPGHDGAEPSGNSVHCLNLLRLHKLTENQDFRVRGERCLAAFSGGLVRNPMSLSELLIAVDFAASRHQEMIIITPAGKREDAQPFLDVLRKRFLPNAFILAIDEDEARAQEQLVPSLQGKIAVDGKATLYVCEEGTCQLPITDIRQLVLS